MSRPERYESGARWTHPDSEALMRRHSVFFCLGFVSSLSLAACGGNVVEGAGGDASTKAASSTDTGGSGGEGGSTSTSTSTSTTTSTSTSTVTGTGGAPSMECATLEAIVLSNPVVTPALSAGGTSTIMVTLTNTSGQGIDYPGIVVEPDHPGITPGSAYNAFFVIFAGQENALDVMFTVDPSVPKGTKVGFTARLMDIQSTLCTNTDALKFEAIVE
jgi:hypothetical protein